MNNESIMAEAERKQPKASALLNAESIKLAKHRLREREGQIIVKQHLAAIRAAAISGAYQVEVIEFNPMWFQSVGYDVRLSRAGFNVLDWSEGQSAGTNPLLPGTARRYANKANELALGDHAAEVRSALISSDGYLVSTAQRDPLHHKITPGMVVYLGILGLKREKVGEDWVITLK